MTAPKRLYFENLDALRCLAALAVVFHHMGLHLVGTESKFGQYLQVLFTFNYHAGFIGVSFFFVLSGFLITYLMLYEVQETSRFSIPHFYLRRFLRIWPLYFASILVGFVFVPFLTNLLGAGYSESASPLMYSVFLSNFDNIYSASPSARVLGVQWSVAIEEQFYLAWPLIFALLGRGRGFLIILIVLVTGSALYRGWHLDHGTLIHFHTLTALNELAVGGLLAYFAFHFRSRLLQALRRLSRWHTAIIYILGISFLFFRSSLSELAVMNWGYRLLAGCFFAFIIADQTFSPRPLFELGRVKQFTSIGRVSYGVYLLHMIPISTVVFARQWIQLPLVGEVFLALVCSIGLSHLSYRYFESFFLRMKKKVSRVRTGGA